MSYNYQAERPFVFTEEGQVVFLKIRDRAHALLKEGGAVMSGHLMRGLTGNSWAMLACIDRLVELKELHEITNTFRAAAQHRVFVSSGERL